jgi:hypothetical protein
MKDSRRAENGGSEKATQRVQGVLQGAAGARRFRLGRRTALLLLVAGFVVSRFIVARAGVEMHDNQLSAMWQLVDLPLLTADPLVAPLYLHSNPPGFNMFIGALYRIAGPWHTAALAIAYWLLGFAILFALYGLLRHFRFSRRAAAALALLFIVSPEAVLYEHWPYATWPVTAMLTAAAWLLSRFEERGKTASLAGFLGLLVAAGCFRSAWHPLFLAAAVALLLVALPLRRRRVLSLGAAALALLLLIVVNNGLLFGSWGSSSWFGMSLWKVASMAAPPREINALVADGTLPPVASLPVFQAIGAYPPELRRVPECWSANPVLAAERKYESNAPNFNHYGFIAVGRAYAAAAATLIVRHPDWYARGVLQGCIKYCHPSWWYGKVWDNRLRIDPYIRSIRLIPLREGIERRLGAPASWDFPFSSVLFLPLCGVVVVAGLFRRLRSATPRPRLDATTLFMLFAVLYTFLAVSFVEVGENNRFRVETDPLFYVLTLVAARDLFLGRYRSSTQLTERSSAPATSRITYIPGEKPVCAPDGAAGSCTPKRAE